jgi:hypothetical protein
MELIENYYNYIIFNNGELIQNNPAINNTILWEGLFSKTESKSHIINFIASIMHNYKNILLAIPLTDGYDGITGLCGWNSNVEYSLVEYAKKNSKKLVFGLLGTKNIPYYFNLFEILYLPLDDYFFENNIYAFFNIWNNNKPLCERNPQLKWRGSCSHDIRLRFVEKAYNPDNDIRLITIWEDVWTEKPDLVKSIIKNALQLSDNKIYARKN